MTKYVLVNGLMKEVQDSANPIEEPTKTTLSNKALTTPYNFADATAAAIAGGTQLAPRTQETIQLVQDPAYTRQFGSYAGNLVDLIGQIFTESRIPIALASKLISLRNFRLHLKIDDSGSMSTITNNGKSRWQNTFERLNLLMKLLQVVPTGTIRFSFLDRWASINIKRRRGMTPMQFYQAAVNFLNAQYQIAPTGGTPIYRSVQSMLSHARKKPTACYLVTDGVPQDDDFESSAEEIEATKNLILNRRNKQYNPFTFLCCSDNPNDTLWMHEIEEIACRPGTLGYVAAIQNFQAECVEVLNDQGAWFPYSESVWLICNLAAALNPFDLDALDQHEPLTKPTLDNTFLGYVSSDAAYEGYFIQHPNAIWAFSEDFKLFQTTEYAYMINSVRDFATILGNKLNADISNRQDNTEFQALAYTEQQVMGSYGRTRPPNLWRERQNFLIYHCLRMETQQLNVAIQMNQKLQQHLWGDYIYSVNISQAWQGYLNEFHTTYIHDAPPSYAASIQIPGADNFSAPGYQHTFNRAPQPFNNSYATMYQSSQAVQPLSQLLPGQSQSRDNRPVAIIQQRPLPADGLPADYERTRCVIC